MESRRPATPTGLAGRPRSCRATPAAPTPGADSGLLAGFPRPRHAAPSPLPARPLRRDAPGRAEVPCSGRVVQAAARAGGQGGPEAHGSRGALGLGRGRRPGACPSLARPLRPPSSSFLKGPRGCGPPWRRQRTGSVTAFGLVVSGR